MTTKNQRNSNRKIPVKKQTPTTSSSGTIFTVIGIILIGLGILCLLYTYNTIKVFFSLKDSVNNPEGEGMDQLGNLLGSIFLFSSVGIESLVIGIGMGILGVIFIIIGTTLWSIGLKRSYS